MAGVLTDISVAVRLAASEPPWAESDMNLAVGDQVSCFSEGRVYANTLLDIQCPLSLQIWSKVGDGDIFRGTQNSQSFVTTRDGVLQSNLITAETSPIAGAALSQ